MQRSFTAWLRGTIHATAVLPSKSNLDAALRLRTRTEIRRLKRELGVTSIFVTHGQEKAMVLPDRIAVMRVGELQQLGPPMEVYRDLANLFVASFIGSPAMNMLDATVSLTEGGVVAWVSAQSLHLPRSILRSEWAGERGAACPACAPPISASWHRRRRRSAGASSSSSPWARRLC
jgi:hypothetical protein